MTKLIQAEAGDTYKEEMMSENEWTTERTQRFWEAIPTEHEWQSTEDKWGNLKCKWCGEIRPKSMLVTTKCRPDITDLNALFKWAVPNVEKILDLEGIEFSPKDETAYIHYWQHTGNLEADNYLYNYQGKSKDPAQALAEAIEKALGIGE